jgi:hypothetical protein
MAQDEEEGSTVRACMDQGMATGHVHMMEMVGSGLH